MAKFGKEGFICMVSGIWSVVVVICSLLEVFDVHGGDNFYSVFTKVSTSMLGVVQFMVSAKLLAYSKFGNGNGSASASSARSWYYSYMLLAITMTLIFTFFYIFTERGYYHGYWGFSFFDMIIFFDIAIFIAFAIFHPPPQYAGAGAGSSVTAAATGSKPNGRMNVDWIPRETAPVPAVPVTIIVGPGVGVRQPASDDMQIKSTNSNLPYARMENEGDSFA